MLNVEQMIIMFTILAVVIVAMIFYIIVIRLNKEASERLDRVEDEVLGGPSNINTRWKAWKLVEVDQYAVSQKGEQDV